MRHGLKIKKIGRNASHRKATLQSMSMALIEHKRITTTLGKARALRIFVEPILHKAKDPSTSGRRQAFRRLQSKEAVKTLYGEIAQAIGNRPGGYTRIVKLGQRGGDAAEMAVVEIVDFNDVQPEGAAATRRKTRRSRSRSGASSVTTVAVATAAAQAPVVDESETPETIAGETAVAPEASSEDAEQASAAAEGETEEGLAESPATSGGPPEVDPAAEAVHSSNPNPSTTGNPQIPMGPSGGSNPGADHGDAEQGAPPGTGEPIPESHRTNLGRSGHRG